MTWVPWRQAWQNALYGGSGFYRAGSGPAGHFTTSTQGAPGLGQVFAEAVVSLARRAGLGSIIDLGAGRGELLGHIHRLAPELHCLGTDVCPRPDLPRPIDWVTSPGGAALPGELAALTDVLVIANEWLDVVPCTVAELDAHAVPRMVLVDPITGDERLGDPLDGEERDWCARWAPEPRRVGDRVEVGLARDLAWSDLLRRVDQGVAVAVDYGHVHGLRPTGGTLVGYRHGHQVPPVPDGSCDLTAHVAMDSLAHDELVTQRDALRRLGVGGRYPERALAVDDPPAYLAALARSSAATALTAADGLGGFWWSVTCTGGTAWS